MLRLISFATIVFLTLGTVVRTFSQTVPAEKDDRRNIILITIDTLRGDSVGFNGSQKVKTPNLDTLARQGINFSRTRAPVPLTLPSHVSIMTGMYPSEHGIRDNGFGSLAQKHTTLAEILKKSGYQTAAFVGSFVLDHRFGLNQGFDHYDDAMPPDLQENQEAERNAEEVYSAFAKWLRSSNRKAPFFAWIHFYDPHAPYNPPEPFAGQYSNDPYSGEIAFTDSVVGKILEDLKSYDKTIVAVTADHGEGLGEHQEQTHSLLTYNTTLHVPMVIYAPGLISSGTHFPDLTRLIDLGPTILDYAQIPETLQGEGISLKTLIENKKESLLKSFSESLYPKLNLGWSDLYGVESGRYHYIDAPKPELYDVMNDPAETQNQIQKFPNIAKRMKADIEQFYKKGSSTKNVRPEEIDPEVKEKLASLGYVSGSGTIPADSLNIDPKERIDIWNKIQAGLFEFGRGNYEAASKVFESVSTTEKNNRLVYDHLCSSYIKLDRSEQAVSCVQRAISNGVDFAALHVNLGQIYLNQKKYDLAQKEFRVALAMDNLNVPAHYFLANALRAAGQPLKAIEEYNHALRINPRYVFALNGLGMTLSSLKKDDDAFNAFLQAVQYDPRNPNAHYNLAVQSEKMKRNQEALRSYQKFLELAPEKNFPQQRQKAIDAIRRLKSLPGGYQK